MNIQKSRRLAHVVIHSLNGFTNKVLLEAVGRFTQTQVKRGLVNILFLRTQDEGEVFRFHGLSGCEKRDPFHQVAQFANISRPAVSL